MKEKILTIPTAFGAPLSLYKNIWGTSTRPEKTVAIVSGLHGDHLNGIVLSSLLAQFLDSVVEGRDPNYHLEGEVISFPVVNLNAIQSGSRLWPYDDIDMNLAFPGNPQGETSEALASAVLKHTADSCWGIILQSAAPHYEDAPHIQTVEKPNGRIKKMCRDMGIATVRKLHEHPKVNLSAQWQEQDVVSLTVSAGSPRTVNQAQCETLFHGIINFMIAEGILRQTQQKTKPTKNFPLRVYRPEDEIAVLATTAGMFLHEVQVGTTVQQGQTIGKIRDLHSGEQLEEITAPCDGFLLTLRQYPIVYEKEPLAIILTAKKSWRDIFSWNK